MHSECSQNSALLLRNTVSQSFACRWIGLAAAGPCWLMLTVAAFLTPSVSGVGTHQQLGLSACSSLAYTGYPCPSCGMTTAVAATVHGRFALAFRAQPFGILLTLAAVVFGVCGAVQFLTARPILARMRPRFWWAFLAVAGLLGGWVWKVLAGMACGQYPLR